MKNRFNTLTKEEKNRIRGLHMIVEQGWPDTSSVSNIESQIEDTSQLEEELVEAMLVESQRLNRYLESEQSGKSGWDTEDLSSIKVGLDKTIGAYIGFKDSFN